MTTSVRRAATAAALILAASLTLLTFGGAGATSFLPSGLSGGRSGLTAADGYLGGRTASVDDGHEPAIARLDPRLRSALRSATQDAARDGVRLRVTSGWRSRAYQEALLQQAVKEYGGVREARRWVNTPEASTHVSGKAVDVGPRNAARWLEAHGDRYGLCRVYANERWHFERLTTPGGSCPVLRANALA